LTGVQEKSLKQEYLVIVTDEQVVNLQTVYFYYFILAVIVMTHKPFSNPIYITQPILPQLNKFANKLEKIWDLKWLTNNGFQHQQLEKKLAEALKVPHLSLFNNGTIALATAVQCLRLSGEVITTPFTFPATPHVLSWNNIKPIFCDIEPLTMNINPDAIEEMITPKTTGILAVHVFGSPCDVTKIQEIADRYGLKVVYDAAHAFMVELAGKGIGGFGDITMFSFHATKLFHTAEGGALTYNDLNLKKRVDLLKNFGIKNEDEVTMPGINGKMNEIQAALGLLVLEELAEERKKREVVFQTYQQYLGNIDGITLLPESSATVKSNQYMPIRINEQRFGRSRDYVYAKLKEFNVITRRYFFPLCSQYACYRQLPSAHPASLPVANQVVQEVLCLPFYGALALADTEKICSILVSLKKK
jgi:dTDP-4-amino-4,6-dideoxygalactose transaminase